MFHQSEPVKILLCGNLSPSFVLIIPALHKHIIHRPDSQQIQDPDPGWKSPAAHTGEETGELSFRGLLHEVFFSLHIRPDVHSPQLDQLRQNLINTERIELIQPVLRIIRNKRICMLHHHICNVLKHLKGRLFRILLSSVLFHFQQHPQQTSHYQMPAKKPDPRPADTPPCTSLHKPLSLPLPFHLTMVWP